MLFMPPLLRCPTSRASTKPVKHCAVVSSNDDKITRKYPLPMPPIPNTGDLLVVLASSSTFFCLLHSFYYSQSGGAFSGHCVNMCVLCAGERGGERERICVRVCVQSACVYVCASVRFCVCMSQDPQARVCASVLGCA